MKIENVNTVIISRPDAIGDVILTLPLCGLIKKHSPNVKIIFLGKTYTQDVIGCCEHVDEFINADTLLKLNDEQATEELKKYNADAIIHVFPHKRVAAISKKAKIKLRVGTTNRLFHWATLNKLVPLSRKNSALHESQLNCKLLEGIGIIDIPDLGEMYKYTGFTKIPVSTALVNNLRDTTKISVVLHPKSNASAREWSLQRYNELIETLPSDKFQIFITGSEKENFLLNDWLKTLPAHVNDVTGKMSLKELIAFIYNSNFLVAASTGPLHIASACGIHAIGIYPPIKPMHPGRWQPIGKNTSVLAKNTSCNSCKNKPQQCICINEISAQQVASIILKVN